MRTRSSLEKRTLTGALASVGRFFSIVVAMHTVPRPRSPYCDCSNCELYILFKYQMICLKTSPPHFREAWQLLLLQCAYRFFALFPNLDTNATSCQIIFGTLSARSEKSANNVF